MTARERRVTHSRQSRPCPRWGWFEGAGGGLFRYIFAVSPVHSTCLPPYRRPPADCSVNKHRSTALHSTDAIVDTRSAEWRPSIIRSSGANTDVTERVQVLIARYNISVCTSRKQIRRYMLTGCLLYRILQLNFPDFSRPGCLNLQVGGM